MLATNFFNSSNNEDQEALWLLKPLVQRRSSFYKEKDELGQIVSGHNMHVLSLCIKLHHHEIEARLWTQSSDTDNQGNQDAIPSGHVVSWI